MTQAREISGIGNDKSVPTNLGAGEKLARRKVELTGMVEKQHLLRAAATLDEKAFDSSALKEAEDEMAAIEDAERELVHRKRSAEHDTASAEWKAQSARVSVLLSDWLLAIEEQEVSARSMVEALRQSEAARAELQQGVYDLTGSVPTLLMASEQESRRSRALSALLAKQQGRGKFGDMRLRPGTHAPSDSWLDAEKRLSEEIKTKLNEVSE